MHKKHTHTEKVEMRKIFESSLGYNEIHMQSKRQQYILIPALGSST